MNRKHEQKRIVKVLRSILEQAAIKAYSSTIRRTMVLVVLVVVVAAELYVGVDSRQEGRPLKRLRSHPPQ